MNLTKASLETVKELKDQIVGILFSRAASIVIKGPSSESDYDTAYDRACCVKDELEAFADALEELLDSGTLIPISMNHFLSIYDIDGSREVTDIVLEYSSLEASA